MDFASWGKTAPSSAALTEYDDGGEHPIVAMAFAPQGGRDDPLWPPLRRLWLDLPLHPTIFDALAEAPDGTILLRYAALDWHCAPRVTDGNPHSLAEVASWGVQITDAFATMLASCAPATRACSPARS